MKIQRLCLVLAACGLIMLTTGAAQKPAATPGRPDATGWADLFKLDLSNAEYPAGVWTFADGILTASED